MALLNLQHYCRLIEFMHHIFNTFQHTAEQQCHQGQLEKIAQCLVSVFKALSLTRVFSSRREHVQLFFFILCKNICLESQTCVVCRPCFLPFLLLAKLLWECDKRLIHTALSGPPVPLMLFMQNSQKVPESMVGRQDCMGGVSTGRSVYWWEEESMYKHVWSFEEAGVMHLC